MQSITAQTSSTRLVLNDRSRLFLATVRAFTLWGDAVQAHADACTALQPSQACIMETYALVSRRQQRYQALETALASALCCNPSTLFNCISAAAAKLER